MKSFLLLLTFFSFEINSFSKDSFPSYLPNTVTFQGLQCITCHKTNAGGTGSYNPFGTTVSQNLKGGFPNWSAIYNIDSDGDGFTNGQELGDPTGAWKQGIALPKADTITAPGDASSHPFNNIITLTTPSSLITLNSATVGGNITSDGGNAITSRGIVWGTAIYPSITKQTAGGMTTEGSGIGTFTSNLTGLTPGTTYHYRSYATNSLGTRYGKDTTFKTLALSKPTIGATVTASGISTSSAISGGNITSDGGATVTDRGVVWGTAVAPTITAQTKGGITHDGTGTGAFTSSIAGLSASTLYHYRSYATNSVGTNYGTELTFTTTTGNSVEDELAAGINLNVSPNPFSENVKIKFEVQNPGNYQVNIIDLAGNKVQNLLNSNLLLNNFELEWNGMNNLGNSVDSGIYFLEIKSENAAIRRRIILVK